jgi:hypothetical protein
MADRVAALIFATAEAVRPFAKRLLASGVPFGVVERRLRALFIDVAERDFALSGRRATDSRVALLTGINRKEVRRLRGDPRTVAPGRLTSNHVTHLISRWTTDPKTTDASGRPRDLPYQAARGASFMRLARAVTSDLAPGVLLEHLVATGAAEVRDGNVVALRAAGFVARAGSAEGLRILAEDPAELIETMLHNVLADDGEPFLQRKVSFDNLGSEAADEVRAKLRREGERFLRRVERLLARYDRDRNPKARGGDRYYAGIGVYFFAAPEVPERPNAPIRPRSRRKAPARSEKRVRKEQRS